MNLTLVDVTCRALEGKTQELEFLYVKGRNVRCGRMTFVFAGSARPVLCNTVPLSCVSSLAKIANRLPG